MATIMSGFHSKLTKKVKKISANGIRDKWVKVFNKGPSKVCGRQPSSIKQI